MISGIGADIELITRFKKKFANKRFFELIFTERERDYCEKKKEPIISYAGKFCAKESVIKAFGKKIFFKEIEIINNQKGIPEVYIKGKLNKSIHCSIAHSGEYAVAYVIIDKNGR
ncbi:4'-phosphopantetheinyl transferase superfamily protein [uncultured archaeon]|nr:4'-phosphopantetheinyl transferase superfamily protein [uncultured archaeon]